MATIIEILGTDLQKVSRVTINSNFTALNASKAEIAGQVFTGPISATNLSGVNTGDQTIDGLLPSQTGQSGKFLSTNGTGSSWQPAAAATGGTVTQFNVAIANGFDGTVASATTTPTLTIKTSVTGILKGNGIAMSAAVAGTDYSTPTGTETHTNKTLTTPTITNPTMSATNPSYQSYSPGAGAAATLSLTLSNTHLVNMPAGNVTIALTGESNNKIFLVMVKQDSVGSRTVTWFSGILWPGGTTPVLTTTANKYDVFGFIRLGVGSYLGFVVGQNL